MTTIFDVIADPTRRHILGLLLKRPYMVGELTEALDISQPGVSKHLRMLRDVGLVKVRQEAQRRWYVLQPEPLMELDAWLADYRDLWSERLDNLDNYLQTLQDEDNDNDPES